MSNVTINTRRKALRLVIATALGLLPAAGQSPIVIPFGPGPDLSVALSVSPLTAGGELTYTATVKNTGSFAATDVTLQEWLPSGVVNVSASPSCAFLTGGIVKCALGIISGGHSQTVVVTVHPITVGDKTTTAVASGSLPDPTPSNNVATATRTITEVAISDVSVTLFDSGPVRVGEELTYTAIVRNLGDDDAANVILTDALPLDVIPISAVPGRGSCTLSGRTVTCALGNFPVGGAVKVQIVVRPSREGFLYNTVAVAPATVDPNVDNNSDTVLVSVSR